MRADKVPADGAAGVREDEVDAGGEVGQISLLERERERGSWRGEGG